MLLTSRNLVLRPIHLEDALWMAEQMQDPTIHAALTIPDPYKLSDAIETIARVSASEESTTFVITDRATDQRYGCISLTCPGNAAPTTGYWVGAEARGKGIAAEALALLCQWAFEDKMVPVVTWAARVGNDASRKTALKVGFRMEGVLRKRIRIQGDFRDCWMASLTPGELVGPDTVCQQREERIALRELVESHLGQQHGAVTPEEVRHAMLSLGRLYQKADWY